MSKLVYSTDKYEWTHRGKLYMGELLLVYKKLGLWCPNIEEYGYTGYVRWINAVEKHTESFYAKCAFDDSNS